MLILKLFMLSLVSVATTDLRVLFFTMDSCPPCKQMEPNVDRLRDEGVAVSKINIRQYEAYARQCQVQRTPTTLIIEGDRVLARHTGAMSYADLKRMLAHSNAQRTPADTTQQQPVSTRVEAQPPARTGGLTPEQKAHRATVRFRVEDSQGVSFATGTIIHRQDDEALVLTCGHVFRDSQGKGKINSDIGFAMGQPTTVVGSLIYYDADKHDIALVAIPCPMDIEPIPVAPESLAVQRGDKVFSLGCDRGAPPTVRQSVLKANTRYSGIVKYDIVGRPVDGRSGGGLFSAGGQLIGVCNAAAVEVDEGIYTGLQSIYWQFAKVNLTHLFRRNAVPAKLSFEPEAQIAQNAVSVTPRRQPVQTAPLGQLSHPDSRGRNIQADSVVAGNDELTPPVQAAVFRGNQVPVNTAIYRGNEMPVRQASRQVAPTTDDMEMIVILRSRSNPAASETYTISRPDSETLNWVRGAGHHNAATQSASGRMARLPDVPRPTHPANRSQMRAQSPR